MTATGPIAWRARSEIPVTWDRLATTTQYGDLTLQIKLDYVKQLTFGTVVEQLTEASLYNPIVLAYAGKLLALTVIPSGIDYWSDQAITFSTSARSSAEGVGYPDRIRALQDRYVKLQAEIVEMRNVLPPGVAVPGSGPRMVRPLASYGTEPLRTPDPATFPRMRGSRGSYPFFPDHLRFP